MLRFLLRRLLLVIPSLAGLLVLTFFLIRVVPADPAAALAGENATPAQIAEIRRQYGLDQPLYVQFAVYLGQVARLDFGESAYSRRPNQGKRWLTCIAFQGQYRPAWAKFEIRSTKSEGNPKSKMRK